MCVALTLNLVGYIVLEVWVVIVLPCSLAYLHISDLYDTDRGQRKLSEVLYQ
jgi:hypothetical protein